MLLNHRSDSVVPIRASGNFLLSYSCYRDAEIGCTLHPFKMYGGCVRLELKGHIWFSARDVNGFDQTVFQNHWLLLSPFVISFKYLRTSDSSPLPAPWLPLWEPWIQRASPPFGLSTQRSTLLPGTHTASAETSSDASQGISIKLGGAVPSRPGWQGPSSGKGQRLRQRGGQAPREQIKV